MVYALIDTVRGLLYWFRHLIPVTVASMIALGLALTVVLLPAGVAGLYTVANRAAYDQPPRPRDFIQGARRYFWIGARWAIVNAAVLALLYLAVFRYVDDVPLALRLPLGFLGLVWLALQFYFWPILLEHRYKGLLRTWGSTALLFLAAPFYSVLLFGLLTPVPVVLTLAFGLPGLLPLGPIAVIGCRAVIERLHSMGRPPEPERALNIEQTARG
ncbi:MAG: hypothetical protein GX573_27195 [Chloroflexi bacterium]|nr:hypothetical protein [Chloroflexota bacterium]